MIAADIEHHAVSDQTCFRKNRPNVCPVAPVRIFGDIVPDQQGFAGIVLSRLFPKCPQSGFRYDVHHRTVD
jgi:hypothetical protein